MRRQFARFLLYGLVSLLILGGCVVPLPVTTGGGSAQAMPDSAAMPAAEPRNLTVLVGGGQDTAQIFAFFPAALRVRAGDTVTWMVNSEEPNTVSFVGEGSDFGQAAVQDAGGPAGQRVPPYLAPVPGGGPNDNMINPLVIFPTQPPDAPTPVYNGKGFLNSGILRREPQGPDAPPNDRFSVTFDTPGIYEYVSLLLPDRMRGRIEVVAAGADDVPSQAEIDDQVQTEVAEFSALVEMANARGQMARSEPGPGDANLWYVRAGSTNFVSREGRAQSFEFLPKELTIQAGDTVVWSANFFHTITFLPAPPPPEPLIPQKQADGPPLILINPKVFAASKPTGSYDPSQYYNSGALGPFSPIGSAWALTFEEPGTYDYICIVHRELGMLGTIVVEERY